MAPAILIRPESPSDVQAIRAVLEDAFPTAVEADLVERLRADGDLALSLVAVAGDEIVGHIALSPMAGPLRALGLGPVAVRTGGQRAGIGRRLVEAALSQVGAGACQAVFVLGDPAYYGRFGFAPEQAAGFVSPYAGPYFMALPLDGSDLRRFRGHRIDYAQAFASLT